VVAFLAPGADRVAQGGLALFRGRFDVTRLEAMARRRGATFSEQVGTRVMSIDAGDSGVLAMGVHGASASGGGGPDGGPLRGRPWHRVG